ncbi:LysR family transcriptional regulator [Oceanospirillum sediminis]|uniref:LysR family transcriptional regulator n=1 Tax=Oceanospirillum sediminis TaxID=2760088 RepID=A0A839ILB8_9GAMM|nr:LysR family transcriptional regulator [Oceanospirillum sediminis]MBB1485342.1 LysR family transcriptional regulator [Oceanospirillum sediminis]
MPNTDQLNAFIAAAESGSFSAAGRRLKKAQSAVSNAVMNLEIETGVDLFDRSTRKPILTAAGEALLKSAYAIMESHNDFTNRARSLNLGEESNLCLAIEQNLFIPPVVHLLVQFERTFPHVELELLDPGENDVPELLRSGRADMGLMLEQENYPQGFHFRGIGHSRRVPVCSKDHPLASLSQVNHSDLRRYRQLIPKSLNLEETRHHEHILSPRVWYAESPFVIAELLCAGLGWASLHESVVQEELTNGELIVLKRTYQQDASLQGIDVGWTEQQAQGPAAKWLLQHLSGLKFNSG